MNIIEIYDTTLSGEGHFTTREIARATGMAAVRYCLGRHSYVVSSGIAWAKQWWDDFEPEKWLRAYAPQYLANAKGDS